MAVAGGRRALAMVCLAMTLVCSVAFARSGAYPEAVMAPHGNDLLRASFASHEIDFSGIMVALDEGADPNLAIDGVPVTYLAARRGRLDIAETLLLDGGAAPPPCTRAMGACPIKKIVDYVRKHGSFASTASDPYTRAEGYAWLVQHGVEVDSVDASGNTALMLAASRGKTRLVLALLKAGANPLQRNNWGVTAKRQALGAGHLLAALLITYYGGNDYAGARLPDSPVTRAVRAQDQIDATMGTYMDLPWLPDGIRFFLTCDHRPPLPNPPPVPYVPPPLTHVVEFAVLPGSHRVIQLTGNPDALVDLGVRIDTASQARTGIRALHADFDVTYRGMALTELPALRKRESPSSYLIAHGDAAIRRIRQLGRNSVQPALDHGAKAWIITHTLVPPELIPRFVNMAEIDAVYRVREQIDARGHYRLLDVKKIATPPLQLISTCCLLR
jgi:hypothetical protein